MRNPAPSALLLALAALAGCETGPAARESPVFSPSRSALPAGAASPLHAAPPAHAPPVVNATDATFDRDLAAASGRDGTTLINFTAEWCGPCRALAPTLDSMAAEPGGRLRVIRLDFDRSPATARRYNISSLPAVLVVRNGVVVKRMVGYQSRQNLVTALASMQ